MTGSFSTAVSTSSTSCCEAWTLASTGPMATSRDGVRSDIKRDVAGPPEDRLGEYLWQAVLQDFEQAALPNKEVWVGIAARRSSGIIRFGVRADQRRGISQPRRLVDEAAVE